MSNSTNGGSRLMKEILIVLAVALIGFVAWWWRDHQADKQLAEVKAGHATELTATRQSAIEWAKALTSQQADAALGSFAAGLYPTLLRDRTGDLGLSIGPLLQVEGVDFIHVLAPDGSVLESSDQKLTVQGSVGNEGSWALAAEGPVHRIGSRAGTVETAMPVLAADGQKKAILWIGYATDEVMNATRPAAITAPPAPANPDAESE